ncbi:hypothetical protein HMPREF9120_02065 [Neisseria sp. oral taxon 020 str. F0370]|nr:hypothetical protein HMPREF9120_02065 [Neisseria sp. oral taxon 020 str. F0370]
MRLFSKWGFPCLCVLCSVAAPACAKTRTLLDLPRRFNRFYKLLRARTAAFRRP